VTAANKPSSPNSIGVFDSGVGGLSVLDALRRRMPQASLSYVGDVAYAPYGERAIDEILARIHRVVAHLVASGARIVVVACNTATVLGIASLRERWPDVKFIGVEPGVKPAAALTRNSRIAIMATSATARSPRLRDLIAAHAASLQVHIEACAGLASVIERSVDDDAAVRDVLTPHIANLRAADVDTVVLGCTHYPFVSDMVQAMLGASVTLVDTACAVAERVAFIRGSTVDGTAQLHVATTGAATVMNALLLRCAHLERVPIARLSI
jgi:glutamate racemase